MSAKHTPGPWKKERGIGPLFEATETGGASCVAVLGDEWFVYSSSLKFEDPEKDASLIAAAPTMYDYLKKRADDGDVEAASILEVIHASS